MTETSTDRQNAANSAQPGSVEAATSGETELDTLLREYETGQKPEPNSNIDVARVLKGLKPVVDYAQNRMAKDQEDVVKGDIDSAFKFVTETEGLKTLEPDDVRGFLEAYSVSHPDFAKAFENRGNNPEGWNAALGKGRDWMTDRFAKFSGSTERNDIEAATAAVTETTDQVPSGKDGPTAKQMFDMSGVEWESYMDAEIAKAG